MRTLHPSRAAVHEGRGTAATSGRQATSPWLWLACGAVLFFAVPWVGTDVIALPRDLYYVVYFTVAVGFFAAFVTAYRSQLEGLWRRNWRWSLVVGALAGAAVAAIVLSTAGT